MSPDGGVGDTLLLLSEVLKPQIPPTRRDSRGWKSSLKIKLVVTGAEFKLEPGIVFVPTQSRGV